MSPSLLKTRYKMLNIKERVGVAIAAIAVIYAVWDFVVMQPMLEQEKAVKTGLEGKNQQILVLSTQIQEMINGDKNIEYKKNRERLESIINQLGQTDKKLLEITSSLIAPDQMAKVLETLLVQSEGLKIRRLQGLGAKPFPEDVVEEQPEKPIGSLQVTEAIKAKSEVGKVSVPKAWRHGLHVEFSGNYIDTLEYLQSLEKLNWKFYWDSVELDVDEYPNVNTAIRVYTLSLDKDWIDV